MSTARDIVDQCNDFHGVKFSKMPSAVDKVQSGSCHIYAPPFWKKVTATIPFHPLPSYSQTFWSLWPDGHRQVDTVALPDATSLDWPIALWG